MTLPPLFHPYDKALWADTAFIARFLKAFSIALAAVIVNYYAVRYATAHAGPALDDIFFDILPFVDVSHIHGVLAMYVSYGMLLFALLRTRAVVFFLSTVATLVFVRSFFVILTHLGIPADATPVVSFYTQGGDLFFSGHTALPFLAALVFWHLRPARYLLLGMTVLMGAEVLLGRLHYSIDVFAAPFIAYGVFRFCAWAFPEEYRASTHV